VVGKKMTKEQQNNEIFVQRNTPKHRKERSNIFQSETSLFLARERTPATLATLFLQHAEEASKLFKLHYRDPSSALPFSAHLSYLASLLLTLFLL